MPESQGSGEIRPSEQSASKEALPVPTVIYEGNINKPDSPYSFKVNPFRLGELLAKQGVSPDKIRDLRVFVFGKGAKIPEFLSALKDPNTVGTVSPETYEANAVGISVDNLWRLYSDLKALLHKQIGKHAAGITSTDRKFLNQLLVNSGRVLDYLEKAPSDRAIAFLDRFIGISIKRLSRLITIHELRHQRDRYDKKEEAKLALIGIVSGLPFLLVPLILTESKMISGISFITVGLPLAVKLMTKYSEHRANKHLNKYTNDPRWLDIVEFTPPADLSKDH